MEQLIFSSSNAGKANELESYLGISLIRQSINLEEIQELDSGAVARAKAKAAYAQTQTAVLVDDTGLYLNAWNGLPGAFVSWYLTRLGIAGFLQMLETFPDRSATALTALGYCDAAGAVVVSGVTEGQIATQARGMNGFGFDPIFIPTGSQMTMSEMGRVELRSYSMRRKAADLIRPILVARGIVARANNA